MLIAAPLVIALKTVVFPLCGSPKIAISIFQFLLAKLHDLIAFRWFLNRDPCPKLHLSGCKERHTNSHIVFRQLHLILVNLMNLTIKYTKGSNPVIISIKLMIRFFGSELTL